MQLFFFFFLLFFKLSQLTSRINGINLFFHIITSIICKPWIIKINKQGKQVTYLICIEEDTPSMKIYWLILRSTLWHLSILELVFVNNTFHASHDPCELDYIKSLCLDHFTFASLHNSPQDMNKYIMQFSYQSLLLHRHWIITTSFECIDHSNKAVTTNYTRRCKILFGTSWTFVIIEYMRKMCPWVLAKEIRNLSPPLNISLNMWLEYIDIITIN